MTLAVALKAKNGIVIAADSLTTTFGGELVVSDKEKKIVRLGRFCGTVAAGDVQVWRLIAEAVAKQKRDKAEMPYVDDHIEPIHQMANLLYQKAHGDKPQGQRDTLDIMVCGYEGKGLHPDLPTIRMLYCSEGFLYPELDLNYWAIGFSQTAMALMDVLYSCEDAAKMARLAVYVISESMRRYRAIGGSIHVAVITEPPDGGYRELQPTEIEQYLKQNADCVGKAVDQFYA